MNGIVPCIEGLQFLKDAGTCGFHFFDFLGKIGQVIFHERGKFHLFGIIKIKIFLGAIIGVVGGVKSDG